MAAACLPVLTIHCILQFVLYRGLIVGHWAVGELVIFGLPNGLALAGYAALFARYARGWQMKPTWLLVWTVVLTLVAGFFSFWASMLLPVNIYGE